MEDIYSCVCPNCGKTFPVYVNGAHQERKFCSKDCWKAYTQKRQEAKKQQKQAAKVQFKTLHDRQLVPEELCRKCKYHAKYGNMFHCGYVLKMDTTRTKLHPEGLTSDCREFEPSRRRKTNEPKT